MIIDKNSVKIGADPEVFVAQYGEIFPCIGILGGSKDSPNMIGEYRSILEDNVCAEFTINPCSNETELVNEITEMLHIINTQLKKVNPGFNTVITPSAWFNSDELEHPQAKEFGCQPDFNVYTQQANTKPDSSLLIRSAGGHIHVSYNDPDIAKTEMLIKALDLFIGIPSIMIDGDNERRKLYGKAGSFRFKDYGFEYRTPSNFWISSENKIKWCYKSIMKAIDFVNSENVISKEDEIEIVKTINTYDLGNCIKLAKKFNIPLEINQPVASRPLRF